MEPQLTITLDRSPAEYRPGELVCGKASWRGLDKPGSVAIRLFWSTTGHGTTDTEIVAEKLAAQLESAGSEEFSFALPQAPVSFSGQLITLTWGVEMVVMPADVASRTQLTVGREGKAVRLPVVETNKK